MNNNLNLLLLSTMLMLSTLCLLNGCNSIEGSDKRIPNVGMMNDPEETELKFT